MFAAYRIDEQLAKALERKVWLPSGGSLVIDRTEAMTVVDVNTGKFTGQGGNLEETVTRNNLEAAEEIVRQLRLRDVGGIVVIDFIDMVLESNRELVLRRLLECLARDRTKHQVAEVTSLGLVQMTRKRVGAGLLEAFSEPCECCNGRGVIVALEPHGARPIARRRDTLAVPGRAAGRAPATDRGNARRRSAPGQIAPDRTARDRTARIPTAQDSDRQDSDRQDSDRAGDRSDQAPAGRDDQGQQRGRRGRRDADAPTAARPPLRLCRSPTPAAPAVTDGPSRSADDAFPVVDAARQRTLRPRPESPAAPPHGHGPAPRWPGGPSPQTSRSPAATVTAPVTTPEVPQPSESRPTHWYRPTTPGRAAAPQYQTEAPPATRA